MSIVKSIVALIEMILFAIGLIPVSSDIDYGGTLNEAPAITTPMYIVIDGESDFSIVIPEGADDCILTAADELNTYIKKISGADLPIITESALEDGKKAIVLENDCDEAGEDGFQLFSDGDRLVINGSDSRGTLYGVYTLLEEYFGVRWFTPTLETVPESKDIVTDANINRVVEPSFVLRRNEPAGGDDTFRARRKMNVSFWNEMPEYGGALTYVLWDVTLDVLVPDALFAEHPEYFAMNPDGTRTTDHVCLSNPDVLPIAVENARKAMRECPRETTDHIHIGQKDNSNYCHCESCEALYEKHGSISAPTLIFTNSFADALDEEFPEFTFTFYAYGETERPPEDLTLRCNENVVPVLCGLHKACRSHPLTECGAQDGDESFENLYGNTNAVIAEDFANWVKIADRTYIYDYTINFLNTAQFFSNFETLQSTMKYMHDIGITGYVYNCGDGHYAAFNELRNYLLAKIQWDVDCDVEYHMMDFINAYYGKEAAPYIKKIIDLQTAHLRGTGHAFDFDWHYQAGFIPLTVCAEIDILWKKALNADISDEQLFNAEVANLSWEYFKANLFIGEYFFLNPFRMQAIEELYDGFASHGLDRVSSFALIPEKSEVDFIQRPFNWGK
ncbi:MAG: DUF4838 domain-containing protein [Clostridia bacterium]|nr:DUF4838 domain-containing protein [Clostridia bacterium]